MWLSDLGTDIMRSLGFLSCLPVPYKFFLNDDGSMRRTARAFPLAGILIALPAAITLALLGSFDAPPLMSAFITVAITTIVTGGLHEDGLADTADGFGGGKDRDAALAIMKDSRIGAYGAIALILSFGLKASAITALFESLQPVGAASCLVAANCLSRGLMVWHWQSLPSARTNGVAASVGHPGEPQRNLALTVAAVLSFLCCVPFLPFGPLPLVLALPAFTNYLFNRLCIQKIGGHTGDTIGASQQLSEITFLCALALAV